MNLDTLASGSYDAAMTTARKRPKLRPAIPKLLGQAHISMRQLARDVEMDPGLMSRKVRGLRPWRLEDLFRISDALSKRLRRVVTIDALTGRR